MENNELWCGCKPLIEIRYGPKTPAPYAEIVGMKFCRTHDQGHAMASTLEDIRQVFGKHGMDLKQNAVMSCGCKQVWEKPPMELCGWKPVIHYCSLHGVNNEKMQALEKPSDRHIAEALYRWMADDLGKRGGWVRNGGSFLPANVLCDYHGKTRFIEEMERVIREA